MPVGASRDGVEEADELLVPMPLHAAADNAAFQHVEGGEQRGGAVALVVVGQGAAAPALERQARLGAVERLDLALLIHRKHHGMGRRIDVEADNVARLGREVGIVGQLELADTVRLQPVRTPDALHRTDADADHRGHRRRGPVRRLSRRQPERERHHAFGDLGRQRRDARRARLVAQQPVHALAHEPLLPAPDGGLGHLRLAHDLGRAEARGGQQHDPGAPDVLLRAVAVGRDGDKTLAVSGREIDGDICAHAPESHVKPSRGNPKRILQSDFIH